MRCLRACALGGSMKALLLTVLFSLSAFPQPGRGPAVRSPEVSPDGKITFRLRAPNAKEVAVTGIGERLAMTKDDQGVWSATTGVLKPDIYTYSFNVDGVNVLDPGSRSQKSSYNGPGQ